MTDTWRFILVVTLIFSVCTLLPIAADGAVAIDSLHL